jgi:hypothetical protein
MPVTPEYNHSTSAAMKNTLDYFLEEYYFKPSIVSYSPGLFGGINAAQQIGIRGIRGTSHTVIICYLQRSYPTQMKLPN